ncbi:MAG: hypothetical protein H6766_05300 [Candidatus Peribacteria bacterium]|nr:MAG: hypothetical protein H6766_05300 [Candidatus Peribacteria bacterium]
MVLIAASAAIVTVISLSTHISTSVISASRPRNQVVDVATVSYDPMSTVDQRRMR